MTQSPKVTAPDAAVSLGWHPQQPCRDPGQFCWAATILLTVLTTLSVTAAERTNITAIIKGKQVEFRSDIHAKAVQKSLELLASCGYMSAKPKWGAGPTEPKSIAEVEKQSHLHLVFSSPVKMMVPVEKVTLQAGEIVISLPLATAGIWVRTGDGVSYFAMFSNQVAVEELQKLLDEAQKP